MREDVAGTAESAGAEEQEGEGKRGGRCFLQISRKRRFQQRQGEGDGIHPTLQNVEDLLGEEVRSGTAAE